MSSNASTASSKAPYYYGELIKKDTLASAPTTNAAETTSVVPSPASAATNSSGNIATSSSFTTITAATTGNGSNSSSTIAGIGIQQELAQLANVDSHQQTNTSPVVDKISPLHSSTPLSLIRGNGGAAGVTPNLVASNLNRYYHQQGQHNTLSKLGGQQLFAFDPKAKNGTESLPRTFQTLSSTNKKLSFNNPNKYSKQGIYQRSLSIFASGVSPLLRKKKSKTDHHKFDGKSNQLKNHNQTLSSSTLGLSRLRRKSEPIMFSYDSITNELSKFQAREEKIVENIDLDFEKMLMNDANSEYMSNASINNAIINSNDVQRQLKLANMQYARKATEQSVDNPYGRTAMQACHSQLQYKEPFYMVYEDNRVKHNDDNIYEEIDFLTLSSLRAQYADTLSLQSYKKKGGSKRSLASSSFTRWFSTRKKNSPSMSEDENPYIDIKISKKQRPPIMLPDAPKDLTKEQLKRRYIVGSIVDSENSYINSLQRIINCYKKPLEESSSAILSQNKINIIFHRLEQILQCHTIFGIALSQCVREWDEKEQIGDVFIASFSKSMVLDIYSDFINNFTNAMETARKVAKSKSAFAQFLQEKSLSSPDRLSFFGLMVKPVQRFPQFILLLSDLLKHTPADHHDRMSLQLALTQLESLADRLNERKRDAERHFAVKQLLKDYLSSSTTNSSHRFLLRQDDIYQLDLDTGSGLVMKTKCRKLYLLNDMLVCVSVPANRLKFAVSLQDVDIMDDVTPATNNLIANSMLRNKGKLSE